MPKPSTIQILGLSSALALTSCADLCHNELVSETYSPSGHRKIVVFTRDCGATTGYSTQASILPANQPLSNQTGNLLILNDPRILEPTWHDEETLSLSGIPQGTHFKQANTVDGVSVSFAP